MSYEREILASHEAGWRAAEAAYDTLAGDLLAAEARARRMHDAARKALTAAALWASVATVAAVVGWMR